MDYFCYQANDHDCGFASLKMLLASLHKDRHYLYLKKGNKRESFSFQDLIKIGKNHETILKGYSYKEYSDDIKMPFLALINDNHLVLVKKRTKTHFYIYDPTEGKLKLSKEEFISVFSLKTIEVESYSTFRVNYKREHILPIRFNALSFILSIVSLSLLFMGLFFVKDNEFVFIPLIFLVLFSFSELVDNWYLIKEINFFDNQYLDLYFSRKVSDVKAEYKAYLDFKEMYFSFYRKIFSSFLMVLAIIVILTFNGIINLVPLLVVLLVALFDNLLFSNKDRNLDSHISVLENSLLKEGNTNIVNDIKMIGGEANKFRFRLSIRKTLYFFIFLVLAFLMMLKEGTLGVNYIIFNAGIYHVFFENSKTLISLSLNNEKYLKSKANFLDKCNL